MKIEIARPPMFDEIDTAFNVAGKPILFAWGDTIFNPEGGKVTKELVEHEFVHCAQQLAFLGGIDTWWRHYIADSHFRFSQELPAHQQEYRAYCKRHASGRAKFLDHVARKLAHPLYGLNRTFASVRHDIITGAVA